MINRYRRKRPKVDASIVDSAQNKREENNVSTFGRFRLSRNFESSPVSVKPDWGLLRAKKCFDWYRRVKKETVKNSGQKISSRLEIRLKNQRLQNVKNLFGHATFWNFSKKNFLNTFPENRKFYNSSLFMALNVKK